MPAQTAGARQWGGRASPLVAVSIAPATLIDRDTDQTATITDGRGGMPQFGGRLTETQIAFLVRYTREVL